MYKNSPREIKDNTYCCVPQCDTRACKNPEIRFHRFPNEKSRVLKLGPNNEKYFCSRRDAWIHALRIGKDVSKRMVVCSRHFTSSDYVKYGYHVSNVKLKVTAVPSQNLPRPQQKNVKGTSRKQNKIKSSTNKEKGIKHADKKILNKLKGRKGLCSKRKNNTIKTAKNKINKTAAPGESCAQKLNTPSNSNQQTEETAGNISEEFLTQNNDNSSQSQIPQSNICIDNIQENIQENEKEVNSEISQVVIKSEEPWDAGYVLNNESTEIQYNEYDEIIMKEEPIVSNFNLTTNVSAEVDMEKILNSEKTGQLQDSTISPKDKKPVYYKEFVIDEREETFGLLLAHEISDLCKNSQLYIKTKQEILTAIADAQMECLGGNQSEANMQGIVKSKNWEETKLKFIISERERIFGLLLASEISILRENPQLYIRTKQTILSVIINAQMELLTGEN